MKIEPYYPRFEPKNSQKNVTVFYRILEEYKREIEAFVTEIYQKTEGSAVVSVGFDDECWEAIRFFNMMPLEWYENYLRKKRVKQYAISRPVCFRGKYVDPLCDRSTVFRFDFGVVKR